MSSRGWILTVAVVLCTGATAGAVEVTAWGESSPGASQHSAYFVLDYDGGPNLFLFGYQWNDGDMVLRPDDGAGNGKYAAFTAANGTHVDAGRSEAMVYAMMAVPQLDVLFSWHQTFGLFLGNFTYDSHEFDVTTFNNPWASTMTLMVSSGDGTWAQSAGGVSSRALSDGSWDGWVQSQTRFSPFETVAPDPAIEPLASSVTIPEPATMGLLASAGAAMIARRRRRR